MRDFIEQQKEMARKLISTGVVTEEEVDTLTSQIIKNTLEEVGRMVEGMRTFTGGSSVNEKDKRVNKAQVLEILDNLK